MDFKKGLFIILVIIAVVLVIATVFTLTSNVEEKNDTVFVRNNTTDVVNTSDEVVEDTYSSEEYEGDDSYYQTYETGQYDSNGNPIYKTVATSSGGQEVEGSHEAQWSESEGLI